MKVSILVINILVPALLVACGSNAGKPTTPSSAKVEPIKSVPGVTHIVNGHREIMKAKVQGKEVVAILTWRAYDASRDGSVTKWYGDMGNPPPKYVVASLMVSVDGRGTLIPDSKVHRLASQWMNDSHSLQLFTQGDHLCLAVHLGDGSESWTASYTINPSTLTLVSHQVTDGSAFRNRTR